MDIENIRISNHNLVLDLVPNHLILLPNCECNLLLGLGGNYFSHLD